MKNLSLVFVLLSLTACDGSSAKGFWGETAPTGVWDQEQRPVCENYNSCNSSCELYGNCE